MRDVLEQFSSTGKKAQFEWLNLLCEGRAVKMVHEHLHQRRAV
jgi:hypothetical protein